MKDKKRIPVMPVLAVLLLLFSLSSWFVTGMYAKYATTTSETKEGTVLSFRIGGNTVGSWGSSVALEGAFLPGDSRNYGFNLDYSGCEVDTVTSIVIKSDHVLPLSISLFGCKTEDVPDAEPLSWEVSEDDGFFTGTYSYQCAPGETVRDFTLSVEWPKGDDDELFRGLEDRFFISVLVDQDGETE